MTAFLDFDTLKVGDCRQLTKTITDADIRKFVELTGDEAEGEGAYSHQGQRLRFDIEDSEDL